MKMKICHVITRMIVGGAQENTLYTCEGLLDRGHEVTLVTGPSLGPEGNLLRQGVPEGLRVIELPCLCRELSPSQDLQAYRVLRKIFREGGFHVVHTHASKAGILGRVAACREHVPFVAHTVHGNAFFRYQFFLKNWFYIVAEKLAARYCDKIYAVAQAMIDQCVASHIAPADKYQLVYSGMDLDAFLRARPDQALRARLGIPEGAPVIGTIARLFRYKGHDVLIQAARKVVDAVPETRFLLVGDGILREQLMHQIDGLGLTRNFVFAGLVPPQEVCRYTALMDVLVHLSLREGLPRSCVQALASRVPVVAYPLDGTPEVVQNGITGFLAEPENVEEVARDILILLKNPQKRRSMGTRGQEMVLKKFSWRRMADILEQDYQRALAAKGFQDAEAAPAENHTVRIHPTK